MGSNRALHHLYRNLCGLLPTQNVHQQNLYAQFDQESRWPLILQYLFEKAADQEILGGRLELNGVD